MHGRAGDPPPLHSRSATQDEVSLRADEGARSNLALTVVSHPCLGRVGEQALLTDLERPAGRVEITRREPLFFKPRREARRPLGDPFLSRRKPLILNSREDGGVVLDASRPQGSVLVDGKEVSEVFLDREALQRGVVLLLSRRIVLLLHEEKAAAPLMEDDFGLVGESAPMIKARNEIVEAARTPHPVLIRGLSGTGKELVAEAVHRLSGRKPFVPVNLSILPTTLAAAELFGAEKGAFDGLRKRRKGAFLHANGGTLFIDELGDVPLDIQPMLFRVLEDHKVRPLGTEDQRVVDVRFVAATDRNLEDAIASGQFRPQLLYRLRNHEIHLPPLAERRQDIGRLLLHFLVMELAGHGKTLDLTSENDFWLPGEMVNDICLHPLSGNVRDLRNIAQRLVSVARRHRWQPDPRDLIAEVDEILEKMHRIKVPAEPALHVNTERKRTAAEIPCHELVAALNAANGTVSEAARQLGIGRTSFYKQWKERCRLKTSETLPDEELVDAFKACDGDVTQIALKLGVPKQGLFKRLKSLGLR